MLEQSASPGFTVPPRQTDNLFLGIFPDADGVECITALARQLRVKHGLRGRLFAADRLHLTLHVFNPLQVDLQIIGAITGAATANTAPFQVEFDRVLSFAGRPGRGAFVLRACANNPALTELHRQLADALKERGLRSKRGPGFNPHVTLLYDAQRVVEEPVEPVAWKATELVLVHSLMGQSRYIPLARWVLRG